MNDWQLGIDLGTSRTRAAIGEGGAAHLVELEGDGGTWMPSCVFCAEGGEIIVGEGARALAPLRPERFDPQPRRLLGLAELYLGDGPVPVTELLAAMLDRAMDAAIQEKGGRSPRRVVLCYPGHWADKRQAALLDAATAAGMPHPVLVSEAEAAARPALGDTEKGRHVAVCDLGASRCEATVLVRTDAGFALSGSPVVRDPLGGDDIDERIVGHLAELLADEYPDEWQAMREPSNPRERRQAQDLREEVRRAKEALSSNEASELSIPGISLPVQLTGQELDQLTGDLAKATVEVVRLVLDRAGLSGDEIDHLYLAGGAGAMTGVQDALWAQLQERPVLSEDPGTAAAVGAALWSGPGRRPRAWSAAGRRDRLAVTASPTRPGGTRTFSPGLFLLLDPSQAHDAVECSSAVGFAAAGPAGVVEITDEPTKVLDSEELAAQLRASLASRPELEERWGGPAAVAGNGEGWELAYTRRGRPDQVVLWQRCLVANGRALVATAPDEHRGILDSLVRRPPPEPGRFETGWTVSYPGEWTVDERLVLRHLDSGHDLSCSCRTSPGPLSAEAWGNEQLVAFSKLPGIEGRPSRVAGRVCGRLDGEIFTFRWHEHARAMRTKVGLAVSGRRAFSVVITLPRDAESLFPALVRHAQVHPELAGET